MIELKNSALMLAATVLLCGSALAETSSDRRQLLLDVSFAPRNVSQVEIGDFHFLPGQIAPVHTHAAPAIGYVSKGTIYYQVEGMPAQVLKAGDAFYEPVGPRILHFDNASKTEEAVFTDFNLEQTGEPFIVFPAPPTEKIDRRTFPTAPISAAGVTSAKAYSDLVAAGKPLVQQLLQPVVGYVATGSVTVRIGEGKPQVVEEGKSFFAPAGSSTQITSKAGTAKIVTFEFKS